MVVRDKERWRWPPGKGWRLEGELPSTLEIKAHAGNRCVHTGAREDGLCSGELIKFVKTFLVLDKGITNTKREEIRMNFMMLEWNENNCVNCWFLTYGDLLG